MKSGANDMSPPATTTAATSATSVLTETELIQFGIDFLQSLCWLESSAAVSSICSAAADLSLTEEHTMTSHRSDSTVNIDINHTVQYHPSVIDLRHTSEYRDFIQVLRRIEELQRRPQPQLQQQQQQHQQQQSGGVFLQYDATDDILLHVFSYLQCRTLVNTMSTCQRWYHLTKQYATYCTTTGTQHHSRQQSHPQPNTNRMMIRHRRQLSSPLELLQAYENIIGIPHEADLMTHSSSLSLLSSSASYIPQKYMAHVPIPILLPAHQPIRVTNCGDTDYNGIYYCTGCNGNGYIFTKPRTTATSIRHRNTGSTTNNNNMYATLDFLDMADSDDIEIDGQPLRCIIARRFSNTDLLWYMSKEVPVQRNESSTDRSGSAVNGTDGNQNHRVNNNYPMIPTAVGMSDASDEVLSPVQQEFSFWAPLTQYTDSIRSLLLLQFPPVSPVMDDGTRREDETPHPLNHNTAWQSLNNTNLHLVNHPPIVELMD